MQFTLFGYPQSGKTTLFNLLTNAGIQITAFDSHKKEPNLRKAHVPDERLDSLWGLFSEKEKKPAAIDFVDLAGTAFGEVKNSTYLNYLRTADGLVHVVRGFASEQIPHPKGSIDIKRDILSMEEELVFTDLVSVESRLEKLEKDLSRAKYPEGEKERDLLRECLSHLEEGTPLRSMDLSTRKNQVLKHFSFLSLKPLLHVINLDEDNISILQSPESVFRVQHKNTSILAVCGQIESEIQELEEEEKDGFLSEYGLSEVSSDRFLKTAYSLLNVITFYTIGEKEVKAWTIKDGSTAVLAAGAIHSDIEKGFIKAEVTPVSGILECGSLQIAKEKGILRLEGKDYVVQDGDVIYFRFAK
ncbi:redox-regulated ATPase YchF [Acidobacteriota bacterium]